MGKYDFSGNFHSNNPSEKLKRRTTLQVQQKKFLFESFSSK